MVETGQSERESCDISMGTEPEDSWIIATSVTTAERRLRSIVQVASVATHSHYPGKTETTLAPLLNSRLHLLSPQKFSCKLAKNIFGSELGQRRVS